MARTSVTIVKNDFPEMIAKGVEAANDAEDKAKEYIAEAARERVAVLTGETRDSITVMADGVSVGGAGLYLEFGTRKMSARPFFLQGVDEAGDIALERLSFAFGR